MTNSSKRSFIGLMLVLIIAVFCFSPQFLDIYSFPPHMRILEGEATRFTVNFTINVNIIRNNEDSVKLVSSLIPG